MSEKHINVPVSFEDYTVFRQEAVLLGVTHRELFEMMFDLYFENKKP